MVGRGDPGVGPGETSGGLATSVVGEQEVTAQGFLLVPWPRPPLIQPGTQEAHVSDRPVVSRRWMCPVSPKCQGRVIKGEAEMEAFSEVCPVKKP